jgi:hypothetical protein
MRRTAHQGLLVVATLPLIALGTLAIPRPASAAPARATAQAGEFRTDRMIERAFRDVIGRAPHDDELRRYRRRIEDEGWADDDIRGDLGARDDYRSVRGPAGRRLEASDVERIIRTAYEDILGHAPDAAQVRLHRRRIFDDGWTEHDLRDALRRKPEAQPLAARTAERIVHRAYQAILHREPAASAASLYERRVLEDAWEEWDVRQALAETDEARQVRDAAPGVPKDPQ